MELNTNYYITIVTDKIANKTCSINPVVVSTFNILVSFVVAFLLFKNKLLFFLLLIVLKKIIDIYNASLILICKKTGKRYEDVIDIGNYFFYILLLLVIYLKKKDVPTQLLSLLVANLLAAGILVNLINKLNKNIVTENILYSIISDNSLLFTTVSGLIIYLIIY